MSAETAHVGVPANAVPLWPDAPPRSAPGDSFRPWLERYAAATDRPRGAVLVCPGGGYSGRAAHEAAPVAKRFNRAGIHGFVLHYRVAPHRHPAPVLDAVRALRLIRTAASDWLVTPERVAILGFSAGGHLAASAATFGAAGVETDADNRLSGRPDAHILCYPVITSGKFGHRGS